jgi:hypothetical protein
MIQMPGGQTVQLEHDQRELTPEELKQLKQTEAAAKTPAKK